ncbi:MAG: Rpn family recombination-promoting nuclease/putative transposase [Okeania sp. SIO2G4]|uniref:Rpn family recombination-promoting nuclease/putative transposase n=1 Tax=unclassified Okeania TaxID=2634635 RepID=UPI0013BB9462|nr:MULTISPECIES: Rpn family recombination-promoting nuclease/putative transposase [unclassified Okeania]NEP71411.1 Rpn family recombination-promoting nuclease/putative transposase [Okeania sp. SIO2G5]NEP92697.1 Rpn family recombination-promoting nuclease/putative transposase [Okeania sp. SIO2F5]NEQ73542.1 Rpn family recombination-promoting nuclease/putative transposase [Okeania sp. SIO2C9]NEQ90082.1 Rpn family recombination-promoting nuclease/putative transposase [Okeania sp. SIO2G4]
MDFVSPKVDYAFKKIFGSEESTEILISFLNAIIYNGEKTIESLRIINPFNQGQVISLKDTYLDIKAVLFDGSVVVIEMQVASMTGFSKRVMYNLIKGYGNQLKTGDDYLLLRPAIAVTITDFIFFKDKKVVDVINSFVFKHEDKNWKYPDVELRLIFVELPKFKKTLAELETLTEKWIFFLKEAARLDYIPENLGVVAEIEQALNIANKINMTPEELEMVERRAIALQDQRGQIAYAEQEGEARGKVEGRLSEAIAFVMRLLKKRFKDIPTSINNQIEDLAVEELESLGEDLLDFNSLEDLESWLNSRNP